MKEEIETNIKKLKTQKRLNVQEQIALRKYSLFLEASYWRKNGIPAPILKILTDNGINFQTSIIIGYEQDFPGISTDVGIIATIDQFFFEFDLDLNPSRTELIQLYSWKNISKQYEISAHKKGIGKTDGWLAMEVLDELNNT